MMTCNFYHFMTANVNILHLVFCIKTIFSVISANDIDVYIRGLVCLCFYSSLYGCIYFKKQDT